MVPQMVVVSASVSLGVVDNVRMNLSVLERCP